MFGCLLLLAAIVNTAGAAATLPKYLMDAGVASHDLYFQGNRYIADSNYSRIIQKVPSGGLAIIFTLKACLSCHSNEPQIRLVLSLLEAHNVTAYRCELQTNPELQKRFRIVRFPYLILLKKEGSDVLEHRYRGLMLSSRVQLFIDSISNPISQVSENIEVDELISMIYEHKQRPQSLFLFISQDIDESHAMANMMRSIARSELGGETEFMIISNPDLAQLLREEYPQWFEDEDKTLLYFRFTTRLEWFVRVACNYNDHESTSKAIKEAMLSSVQELTHELYKTARATEKVVFVCLIDSAYRVEESQKQLNILQSVLAIFRQEIYLFWIEGSANPDKKKILGVSVEQPPPTLALLDFSTPKPQNIFKGKFESKQIGSFIRKVLGSKSSQYQLNKRIVRLLRMSKTIRYFSIDKYQRDVELSDQINDKIVQSVNKSVDTLIFSLQSLFDSDIEGIAATANRLFKLLYKQIEVVFVLEDTLEMAGHRLQDGVHFWQASSKQLVKLAASNKCEFILNQLSKWVSLPANPCVPESELHNYLLNRLN